jgi:hypothetical protein
MRGRGDLHFTIGPSGEIVAASFVTSALEDTVFEACVVEAIRGARRGRVNAAERRQGAS